MTPDTLKKCQSAAELFQLCLEHATFVTIFPNSDFNAHFDDMDTPYPHRVAVECRDFVHCSFGVYGDYDHERSRWTTTQASGHFSLRNKKGKAIIRQHFDGQCNCQLGYTPRSMILERIDGKLLIPAWSVN